MAKCVLLFLFLMLISCSENIENKENIITKFTQIGNVSKFEQNDKILLPAPISADLRIMKINKVSVWEIDGDIPDSLMLKQENSIAVLGENAVLPKVFALEFSQIILKPNFPEEKILKIMQNYDGILTIANENQEIILTTDGVFWNR